MWSNLLCEYSVDVFGTVRSRLDALAYNNEAIKAKTSFEISAFDKTTPKSQLARSTHWGRIEFHYYFDSYLGNKYAG